MDRQVISKIRTSGLSALVNYEDNRQVYIDILLL